MPTSEQIEKAARAIAEAEGWALIADLSLPFSEGSRIGKAMHKAKVALSAAEGVKPRVKPLAWAEASFGDTWYAKSILGEYAIWEIENGYFRAPDQPAGTRCDGDLDAAKAAAQADYETRIFSALQEGE